MPKLTILVFFQPSLITLKMVLHSELLSRKRWSKVFESVSSQNHSSDLRQKSPAWTCVWLEGDWIWEIVILKCLMGLPGKLQIFPAHFHYSRVLDARSTVNLCIKTPAHSSEMNIFVSKTSFIETWHQKTRFCFIIMTHKILLGTHGLFFPKSLAYAEIHNVSANTQ